MSSKDFDDDTDDADEFGCELVIIMNKHNTSVNLKGIPNCYVLV